MGWNRLGTTYPVYIGYTTEVARSAMRELEALRQEDARGRSDKLSQQETEVLKEELRRRDRLTYVERMRQEAMLKQPDEGVLREREEERKRKILEGLKEKEKNEGSENEKQGRL